LGCAGAEHTGFRGRWHRPQGLVLVLGLWGFDPLDSVVAGPIDRTIHFKDAGRTMAIPQLLVHDKKDTVGVVVVEGLKKGTDMLCVVTHDNSSFKLKSRMDVPIGHKVALVDIKKGDTIWKYGQDIGVAKAKIGKGEHVHVHNVKTKRW
jgi:(2R)-sulfolactate sulfo-lyase subunit alpha